MGAKALGAMLRVNFLNLLLTTFSFGRSKKRRASGVAAFVFLAAMVLLLSGTYSFLLGYTLATMGGLDVMLLSMTLGGMVFALVLTIYTAQGLLFSTKDVDLVFSLPVSSFSVLLSRVLALYLEVLLVMEFFCLPAGIAYLFYGGGGGALFLALYLIAGAFLALLPTAGGVLFGGLITLLVSRLRHKNLFISLFSTLLFALFFYAVFGAAGVGGSAQTAAIDVDGLRQTLFAMLPPLRLFASGVLGQNIAAFLGLCALCTAPFLLVTWAFSLPYKGLLTRLASHHLRENYKLGKLRAGGSGRALFQKEAAKFFGTPAYLLNAGIGALMALVLGVLALVNRQAIQAFMAQLLQMEGAALLTELLPAAILAVLAFVLMTITPAASSISLEGKYLWILKEAPVSTAQIFAVKAGFNFVLDAVTVPLAAVMICIGLSVPWLYTLGIVVLTLLFAAYASMAGLYLNLLFPKMDAVSDTAVVKQGASVLLTMLACVVAAVGLGALYFAIGDITGNFLVFCLVGGGALALLDGVLAALLFTNGKRLFAAL